MPFKFYLYIVISMIIWGSSFVFTKICLQSIDPIALIWLRLFISLFVLIPIAFLFYRDAFKFQWKDLRFFGLLAIFEPFLYFLGENFSLVYLSASLVSVIVATIPVFTTIFAVLIFREKLTSINALGIAISICGTIFILLRDSAGFGAMNVRGVLLAFLAVFSATCYVMILKKLLRNYNPIVLLTWQNIIGCLLFTPLLSGFSDFNAISNSLFTSSGKETVMLWTALLILSFFCSAIAFLFFSSAIKTGGIVKTNIFSNIVPIVTFILAAIMGQEYFSFVKFMAVFIVVGGLALAQRQKPLGKR
ncbi:MAG: DMT family transporter [Acidobacteriota bacterium]|nr:DMT family transporter [Acidobacteriota bacterium]